VKVPIFRRCAQFIVPATLSGTLGWAWPVVPAHQALQLVKESHDQWWQEAAATKPRDYPPVVVANQTAVATDDFTALSRWQTLLAEHGLSGWQGRSLPKVATRSAAGPEMEKLVGHSWQLEGPATFKQGLGLLQDLFRVFPHVLLLSVQVQPLATDEALQWRLELRWEATRASLASLWPKAPATRPKTVASGVSSANQDPFAQQNVLMALRDPEHPGAVELSQAGIDQATVSGTRRAESKHVLPRVSLQHIQLLGVVARDEHWEAWVTGDAGSASTAPLGAHAWHRLRPGEWVGAERARVSSIRPQQLALRVRERRADGHWSEREHLLNLGGQRP
jgi:Tfp pilus assembly protein PilP